MKNQREALKNQRLGDLHLGQSSSLPSSSESSPPGWWSHHCCEQSLILSFRHTWFPRTHWHNNSSGLASTHSCRYALLGCVTLAFTSGRLIYLTGMHPASNYNLAAAAHCCAAARKGTSSSCGCQCLDAGAQPACPCEPSASTPCVHTAQQPNKHRNIYDVTDTFGR